MKGRILLVFVVLAVAGLAFMPLSNAVAGLTVYGYTDQSFYKPGDSGTLRFWVYNSGTVDLVLKNVSIYYPWYNPAGLWAGNDTIIPPTSTALVVVGGNWSGTDSFTVPSDGRAPSGTSSIRIVVGTDEFISPAFTVSLTVTSVPSYFSLQNMGDLTLWLEALVALVVVAALIVAAAIFLALRMRRMPSKSEQKVQ
jgi:hypothetical protein